MIEIVEYKNEYAKDLSEIILDNMYKIKTKENKCCLYIENKCSIYENRPIDCRLFPYDIRKNKNENWTTNTTTQQLVKRKIGSSIHQNYRDNLFDYFLIESKDEMKWKIIPETKKNSRLSFTKS